MTLQKWGAFLESVSRRFNPDGAYGKRSPLVGGRFAFSSWREPTGPPLTRAVATRSVARVALGWAPTRRLPAIRTNRRSVP